MKYYYIYLIFCISSVRCYSDFNNITTFCRDNPLNTELNEMIDFDHVRPDHIIKSAHCSIAKADSILSNILLVSDSMRTFENTLLRLDDLYNIVFKTWNPIELLASVSDKDQIRLKCDEASLLFSSYMIELSSNPALYNALILYSSMDKSKPLPAHRKMFLESELRDFKNSGLGLSSERQNDLKQIQKRISELSIRFRNNINRYTDTLFINKDNAEGLSENYKNDRYFGDGLYAIDLSYPTYYPFMKYAESDSMRKLLNHKFLNKGMPDNIEILDEILILRNQYALLLDYSSYAELTLQETMAGTSGAVWEFENNLRGMIQNKADWDTKQLQKIKNKLQSKENSIVKQWEKYYYENILLQNSFNVDANEVKKYFQLDNVIRGLFYITNKLFGIEYSQLQNPSVWHPEVRMYEVRDSMSGSLLGVFYLDLFPRKNKYQHAAEFTIFSGKKIGDDYQLPVACLVCNFPRENPKFPSLLSHDDVETLFHEFGHLLHDLLSITELSSQAGTSTAMDFVEAPSQMLENWVWHKESLKLFARHYQTGNIIPDSLLNRMLVTRNSQSGNNMQQQIFYGMLDMTLHDHIDTTQKQNSSNVIINLQNRITHYAHVAGTNQLASFDHLLDYSASYYGYLWSEVYAADMFSVFENNGVMDAETGRRFRKMVLEKGGSENPMLLVEIFLNRKPDNLAFLRKQGISK